MHFLLTTFGSAGDVFPMLGLALEIKRRGHDATLITNEYFRPLSERYAVRFEPLGTHEQFEQAINDPHLWNPRRAFGTIFRLLEPALKQQYETIARYHTPGQTAVVANCLSFGAYNAQDKLGLPLVTVHLQPGVIWSDLEPPAISGLVGPRWFKRMLYRLGERLVIDPVVGRFLNPWRAELGLPPVRNVTRWWHSRDGVVCLFPPWYCPPAPDWPARLVQTDFPLWDDAAETLSPEVEAFLMQGDPPLVFTPGSANVFGRDFFAAAVEACGRLERRGVLLTRFPQQLPTRLCPGVVHFPFVPFSRLLPRAAAVAHHGGIGSVSQAMAGGVPQLLMPLAHDQFDNAARIKRLQLGDWLPAPKFDGSRVAERLRRLLDSPSVARACREAAAKLAARDGLVRTAQAIEELVAVAKSH